MAAIVQDDTKKTSETFETPVVKSESTFFKERDEVLKLIHEICKSSIEAPVDNSAITEDEQVRGPIDTEKKDQLFKIFDKYQEESAILDPSLNDMVNPLMEGVRQVIKKREIYIQKKNSSSRSPTAKDGTPGGFPYQRFISPSLHRIFQIIYCLCKVRGYKRVIRLMPVEVQDVEPTMHILLSQDQNDYTTWETRYVLLLWLSMLVMVPFDLTTIDSTLGNDNYRNEDEGLIQGMVSLCKHYLGDPGPTRDAAAVCLSKLLTRPDMEAKYLTEFLQWSNSVISGAVQAGISLAWGPSTSHMTVGGSGTIVGSNIRHNSVNVGASVPGGPGRRVFLSTGVLTTLVMIFKHGHRDRLEGRIPLVAECMHVAAEALTTNKASTLQRKLTMKLSQRIGLQYMPPRLVKWRYQRGQRSLLDNLSRAGVKAATEAKLAEKEDGEEEEQEEEDDDDEDSDDDVPEEMEEVIEQLLIGLRDKDTVVRWSAAKGIGRITGRLPRDFADDVVGEVLNLFSDGEGDGAWHGGCLALAELARRGLLVPERLPEVVPVVLKALVYDVRRGRHSVGSHVRDAACYVCWAFARAYAPDVLRPHVLDLSRGMLITALFDREVNCRRAASAAFQENVGRQGHENFVHGIEIITKADYFALGNRQHAYMDLGPFIAGYDEYRRSLVDHLASAKLMHWDVGMRALTAATLAKIAPLDPTYFAEKILPDAMKRCLNRSDLLIRHGNTILVAELILVLSKIATITLSPDVMKTIRNLVPKIEKARLYRGRGGEIMRAAACRLLECMALAKHELSRRAQLRMVETIDECLKHPNIEISEAAVGALKAMTKQYFVVMPKKDPESGEDTEWQKTLDEDIQRFPVKYCDIMRDDDNPGARRGYVLGLGVLPYRRYAKYNPDVFERVLSTIIAASKVGHLPHEKDAETRRNAVRALGDMCHESAIEMSDDQLSRLFEAVIGGLYDYAADTRGDCGSWVRVSAMKSLPKVLRAIIRRDVGLGPHEEGEENNINNTNNNATVLPALDERMPEDLINQVNQLNVTGEGETVSTGDKTVSDGSDSKRFYSPQVSSRVIGGILRQLAEKIDSVRECAGENLEDLLHCKNPEVNNIPFRSELIEVVSAKQEARYALPHLIYPRVVKMLDVDCYRFDVICGLVHSAGDVNETGSRSARNALLQYGKEKSKAGKVKDLYILADNLYKVLSVGGQRLIIPTLKSIAMLLKHGVFDTVNPSKTEFFTNMFDYVKKLIQRTRKPMRLLAGLEVLLGFLNYDKPICTQAVVCILSMIGHPYPIVRARSSQELYTATLTYEDVIMPDDEEKGDEAITLLVETSWAELDHESAVEIRDQLYGLLEIEKDTTMSFDLAQRNATQKFKDEEKKDTGYQSLVNEMHGGL